MFNKTSASGHPILLLAAGLISGAFLSGCGKEELPREDQLVAVPLRLPMVLNPGETLEYQLDWGAIPVARGIFSVAAREDHDGADTYRLECKAETIGLVAKFWEARGRFTSWLDVKQGFSRGYQARHDALRLDVTEELRLDYARGKAEYRRHQIRKGVVSTKERSFDVAEPVQDALSALYVLRVLDLAPFLPSDSAAGAEPAPQVRPPAALPPALEPALLEGVLPDEEQEGEEEPEPPPGRRWAKMLVVGEKEVSLLALEAAGREELTVKLPEERIFKTLRVIPRCIKPRPRRKGSLTLWLEEQTGVPLKAELSSSLFTFTVTLTGAKNVPWPEAAPADR